jgi:lipoprotein-releasing system permease protein
MRLPVRLAFRYIVKRRSGTLVHLISGISVLVIAAVTTAMVAILSAFNGIEDLVHSLFGTLDAPCAVLAASGPTLPEELGADFLADAEGVASWAPILEEECVVRAGEAVRVASMMGVDKSYPFVSGIREAVFEGAYLVDDSALGYPCACLGLGVRTELSVVGDSVDAPLFSVSAPIRGKRLSRHRERAFETVPMHACGTFSINADLDTRYLLVPLASAQEALGRPGEVSRFEVQSLPGWSEEELAESLRLALADVPNVAVRTRSDKHKFITQTNRAEKWATFAILSFILIVAAFNIMASLTMLLLDKAKDLEVLRSMGMPMGMMQEAFGLQGLVINVVGGLAGVLLGSLIVLGQAQYGWLKLQGSVVPSYPVRLDAMDVLGTLVVVVLVGGLGSSAMVRQLIRRQYAR